MNLKQLNIFCTIVDSGSASGAADKLHVAATAISMQLAALEDDLGGKLFDRSTRPMTLTTLGQFIYPKARELLSNARQIYYEAQGIAGGELGWLSIGFVRSTLHSLIPQAVRHMRAAFPKVRIDLDEMLSEHQSDMIRKGVIHIGISRHIGDHERESDMRYFSLLNDPMVVAVPIHHPLAAQTSVKPAELDVMPFICFPKDPSSQFSRLSLAHLRQHGGTPSVGYEAKEIHTALGLVSAGLGVTLVGKTVSQNNRTDITFLPLDAEPLNSEIYAVTALDLTDPLAENFVQILKHTAASFN